MAVYFDGAMVSPVDIGLRTYGKFRAVIIDYTGEIILEEWLNTGDDFVLYPPTKAGMVFQGWSTAEEITNNKIKVQNHDIVVGAVYTTESGLNEFDIEITRPMVEDIETNGYTINFYLTGTKDWGDGSSDTEQSHTYYSYGKFTIKCNGRASLPTSTGVFGQTADARDEILIEARIANWTSIPSFSFTYTNALRAVSVSRTCNFISGTSFSQAYSLRVFVFPNSINAIYGYIFNSNSSLNIVVSPQGVETVDAGAFYACQGLTKIKFAKGLTTVGGSAFNSCRALEVLDLSDLDAVPTLSGSSGFTYCLKTLKIIVKDNLYDEFISATNWITYKNYIYKASEVGEW